MATSRTRGFNGDGGEERWGCLSFHPVDRRWPPRLRESHTCTLGSFLGPYPDGGRPGQVRIVVVSAPGDMRGLNQRELEILGLLVEDWSDQCISAAMGCRYRSSPRTFEGILVKLGAATRALATLRAVRQGLYPRSLGPARA